MQRWPSLQKVLAVWFALTAIAYVAYVAYMHSQPPDELVMASTLSFQAAVGLVVVGLPSVLFLALFLLVGSIAKRWLLESPHANGESQGKATQL
jgi:hypothetical protein